MSQRHSKYERMPRDTYITPRWVYEALYTVEPWARHAWDCAPINSDIDFLRRPLGKYPAIATNPPFNLATEFCRHAIMCAPRVAMLLPMQFDCAKRRDDLFARAKCFRAKYALTRRIRWENLEQKKAGPSQNHAWYVWDHAHSGPPTMGWL